MKRLLVLFLLCGILTLGVNGQSKKFERKLKKTVEKPYHDKVFECKKHPLPLSDFQMGEYQMKITINSVAGWVEYDVFRDKMLVAHINVYSKTIIKITAIKNVSSFMKAVEELKTHPEATIVLTGESWYKEIAPYLKEAKENETKYIVVYEGITYTIITNATTTMYKNK